MYQLIQLINQSKNGHSSEYRFQTIPTLKPNSNIISLTLTLNLVFST